MTKKSIIFLLFVAIFFWMTYTLPSGYDDYPEETIQAAIWKCIPIATLIWISYSTPRHDSNHGHLTSNIAAGLFFSMFGDFCFIWRHDLFLAGMGFFAVAHVFYIRGFGVSSLCPGSGVMCLLGAVMSYVFIFTSLPGLELQVSFIPSINWVITQCNLRE